jgi:hypothetical protein
MWKTALALLPALEERVMNADVGMHFYEAVLDSGHPLCRLSIHACTGGFRRPPSSEVFAPFLGALTRLLRAHQTSEKLLQHLKVKDFCRSLELADEQVAGLRGLVGVLQIELDPAL